MSETWRKLTFKVRSCGFKEAQTLIQTYFDRKALKRLKQQASSFDVLKWQEQIQQLNQPFPELTETELAELSKSIQQHFNSHCWNDGVYFECFRPPAFEIVSKPYRLSTDTTSEKSYYLQYQVQALHRMTHPLDLAESCLMDIIDTYPEQTIMIKLVQFG